MTKAQPENNIMRGAFYALGAALSGAQTTALCSFDEAYTIPTPRAALLSLRTLEILMDEVGLRDTVDPLAGSYFIETLTKQMEEKILEEMKEIQEIGGMVHAVATGFIRARPNSRSFSSLAWGAWSEAITSMAPSRRPARMASTSAWVRRGGLIL